ncbi:MAG: PQQ-dependent sugar dehydrogenase [Myxococcota bacterium]|nr:PQQ-dependent sugar dehydrogenase [Myxococcota bacterium]
MIFYVLNVLALLSGCQSELSERLDFDSKSVQLKLNRIGSGRFDNPVLLTHAPDKSGRIFVLEKMGKIQVIQPDGTVSPEPYLNLLNKVDNGDLEEGLLGLDFEPDFERNPRLYVYYMLRPKVRPKGRERKAILARYTLESAQDARVNPNREEILLEVEQPDTNHNGGMVSFGPDGMLYVGLGDGGGRGDNFGNGQNPSSVLGSILRLDVRGQKGYQVPADNPWADETTKRGEIWAMGFRNPWRFYFHPKTNDVYIGDVGESHMEEISIRRFSRSSVPNFGWPIMEGSQCYPEPEGCSTETFELPVHSYPHNEGNCAVIAGPIYQGKSIPQLSGVMLFGDYCSGNIWGLWRGSEGWQTTVLVQSNTRISSFGEDEVGEILVADLNGHVYRLSPK